MRKVPGIFLGSGDFLYICKKFVMTRAEQWFEELRELVESGALEVTEEKGFFVYKINPSKFPENKNFLEFLGDLSKVKGNTL